MFNAVRNHNNTNGLIDMHEKNIKGEALLHQGVYVAYRLLYRDEKPITSRKQYETANKQDF